MVHCGLKVSKSARPDPAFYADFGHMLARIGQSRASNAEAPLSTRISDDCASDILTTKITRMKLALLSFFSAIQLVLAHSWVERVNKIDGQAIDVSPAGYARNNGNV